MHQAHQRVRQEALCRFPLKKCEEYLLFASFRRIFPRIEVFETFKTKFLYEVFHFGFLDLSFLPLIQGEE